MNQSKRFFAVLCSMALSTFATALEVGDTGPCVVLEDIQTNGQVIEQCIRTPRKKGQFVIIDFFHPKCDDCLANLEKLSALANDVFGTATTRLVGSDRNEAQLRAFLDEHKAKIIVPVSLDTRLQAMRAYGVNAVPTVFVLNSRNKILFKHIGALTSAEVEEIRALVK